MPSEAPIQSLLSGVRVLVRMIRPPAGEPREAPAPTEDEIGYLLEQVNSLLATPLSRADVISSFAGLRPLVSGDASTARLSREHVVSVEEPGLVTVSDVVPCVRAT